MDIAMHSDEVRRDNQSNVIEHHVDEEFQHKQHDID